LTRRGFLAFCALALAATRPAFAAELSPHGRALLMLKVIAYDRNLKRRAGKVLRIAVIHRAGDPRSAQDGMEMAAALKEVASRVTVAGLVAEVVLLPLAGATGLADRLRDAGASVAYVADGLAGLTPDIATGSRRAAVLTATGSRAGVEAGLSIGLVRRGLGAAVLVNLPASRREGADIDSELLDIAEVFSGEGRPAGE